MTDINTLISRIDQQLATEVKAERAAWEAMTAANRERGARLQRYDAVAKHFIELLKTSPGCLH
jgi:hypothetical protein